jgi:hypothetical protein
VKWDFPQGADDDVADGGIPANSDCRISAEKASAPSFDCAGASTSSARATDWAAGTGSKAWVVCFSTAGYGRIKVSSKQRSSGFGPRDFKAQYSLDSGGTWKDVPDGTIKVDKNWTFGVFNRLPLPAEADNRKKLSLRWVVTSGTSVNEDAVGELGASNIDDIVVTGMPYEEPKAAAGGGKAATGTKELLFSIKDSKVGDGLPMPVSRLILKTEKAPGSAFSETVQSVVITKGEFAREFTKDTIKFAEDSVEISFGQGELSIGEGKTENVKVVISYPAEKKAEFEKIPFKMLYKAE